MFTMNDKDIKRFEADLKTFGHRAYPFATKNTLNQAAFQAQRIARIDVRIKMINRNAFSVKSIQVEKAGTLNVNRQAAIVGSTADYMEDQEFGAVKSKTGKFGVAIPTSYAAGQGENTQPRFKMPRKPNKLANIRLRKNRGRSKGRKQANIVAIRQAAESGSKYVFLDLGRHQGIFRVTGGKQRPKIKMVWDLSHDSVVIPRNPWLKPAVDRTKVLIPEIYKKSLIFQLRRMGLFLP